MIYLKNNIKLFRTLINLVSNINFETDFIFDTDNLKIKIIDPSNTNILNLKIKKDFFEKYEVSEKKVYTLNLEALNKIISKLEKTDMTLDVKDDAIYFSNKKHEFKLSYYVGNEDARETPSIDFTAEWKASAEDFAEAIAEYDDIGNSCTIFSEGDNLIIKTKEGLIEGKTIINTTKVKANNEKSYYNLNLMSKITGIKTLFKDITFKYGNEMPCCIEAQDNNIEFMWILAAMITGD